MTTRPRRRFWLKLAAGLLFAVLAYGGAYSVLVDRVTRTGFRYPAQPILWFKPQYRGPKWMSDSVLPRFFALAHWVDRELRPHVWSQRDA